jgi:hypothetical protein
MEIDSQPSSGGEVIEDLFEAGSRLPVCFTKDESVIRILKDRARNLRGEGMQEGAFSPGQTDKALENVGDNNEEVGGEGVSLAETIPTSDPVPRNAVKEDCRVPGCQNPFQPGTPPVIETSGSEDLKEAGPVDRIEGLPEVNLKDNGWGFPQVAAPKEVSSIDDVFRNASWCRHFIDNLQ